MTQEEISMIAAAHREVHRLYGGWRGFIEDMAHRPAHYPLSEKQHNLLVKIHRHLQWD